MLIHICIPSLGVSFKNLFMRGNWLRHVSGVSAKTSLVRILIRILVPSLAQYFSTLGPPLFPKFLGSIKRQGPSVLFGAPWQFDDAPCLHCLSSNLALLLHMQKWNTGVQSSMLISCYSIAVSKSGLIVTFSLACPC